MKNILSSLNESEKKRILEMHYRASGKQYLMEGRNDVVIGSDVLKTVGASEVIIMPQNDSVPVDFISFKMSVEKVNPEGGVAMPTYYCTTNEKNGYFAGQLYQYKPYNFTPEQITLIKTNGQKQCDHSKSEFNKPKGDVTQKTNVPVQNKTTTTPATQTLAQQYKMTRKDQIILTREELDSIGAFSAEVFLDSTDRVLGVGFKMKKELSNPASMGGGIATPFYSTAVGASGGSGRVANGVTQVEPYVKDGVTTKEAVKLLGEKQVKASNSFK